MPSSYKLNREKSILARFVELLTFELDLDLLSAGSTTLKSPLAQRELEPAECYWTRNEPLVRGTSQLDLRVDSPPDLVIEVEVTNSVQDRLAIFAALGVPEIWRFQEDEIQVLLLQRDGRYAPSTNSLSFPDLPMKKLSGFVMRCHDMRETDLMRSFVDWVRAGMPTEG
ncbi:MAG: Uma2 family endonuclease [Isosphaeraceae bacterium]